VTTYSPQHGLVGPKDSAAASSMSEQAQAPILVLTYELSGAYVLRELLAGSGPVVCTAGTGIIPLCREVARSWNKVENRLGEPSALAIASIRALVSTMSSVIVASGGGARWCETVIAPPDAVESFVAAFPATTLLCLHRRLDGVLAEGLRAYPWGLARSSFWPYSGRHPGNNVAAIAEYWADRTEALLGFESRRPSSCRRVKHDDLASEDGEQRFAELCTYLGLHSGDRPLRVPQPASGMTQEVFGALSRTTLYDADVPPDVIQRIHELHISLGYTSYFQH
jgi:hypothetical protein